MSILVDRFGLGEGPTPSDVRLGRSALERLRMRLPKGPVAGLPTCTSSGPSTGTSR